MHIGVRHESVDVIKNFVAKVDISAVNHQKKTAYAIANATKSFPKYILELLKHEPSPPSVSAPSCPSPITASDVQIVDKIGMGSFAIVYKVKWQGKHLALKAVATSNESMKQEAEKEIQALSYVFRFIYSAIAPSSTKTLFKLLDLFKLQA